MPGVPCGDRGNSCLQFDRCCLAGSKFSLRINCLQDTNFEETSQSVEIYRSQTWPSQICSIQYSASLLNWPSCNPARGFSDGGILGQTLSKLHALLADTSTFVSIQCLVLITVAIIVCIQSC